MFWLIALEVAHEEDDLRVVSPIVIECNTHDLAEAIGIEVAAALQVDASIMVTELEPGKNGPYPGPSPETQAGLLKEFGLEWIDGKYQKVAEERPATIPGPFNRFCPTCGFAGRFVGLENTFSGPARFECLLCHQTFVLDAGGVMRSERADESS